MREDTAGDSESLFFSRNPVMSYSTCIEQPTSKTNNDNDLGIIQSSYVCPIWKLYHTGMRTCNCMLMVVCMWVLSLFWHL